MARIVLWYSLRQNNQIGDTIVANTILIVEDSVTARMQLKFSLEALGFLVLEAETGRQGLESLTHYEGQVDLIVSDHNMHDMTGLEMIKLIRTLPDPVKSNVMIIFLTSDTSPATRQEALDHKVRAVIYKPIKTDPFAAAIKKMLGAT